MYLMKNKLFKVFFHDPLMRTIVLLLLTLGLLVSIYTLLAYLQPEGTSQLTGLAIRDTAGQQTSPLTGNAVRTPSPEEQSQPSNQTETPSSGGASAGFQVAVRVIEP